MKHHELSALKKMRSRLEDDLQTGMLEATDSLQELLGVPGSYNHPTGWPMLNPISACAPSCSKEHDPTESVDYAQRKRTQLHERAPNSKTN